MKRISALILVIVALASSALSAGSLRFAVVGDTQAELFDIKPISDDAFAQIVQLVLAADPPVQFVVQAGDLVNGKFNDRWLAADFRLWREIADPWYQADFLGLKVYPTPGNHDQFSPSSLTAWQEAFPELPDNGPENNKKMTYSFDLGPCHFAVVNTSNAELIDGHLVDNDWLEADLAASDKPVKFVIGHEPAYPVGRHIGSSLDARPEHRDRFWQILADYGVKAYFCGHEHVYDHWVKDGVHQIITGSGGVPSTVFNYLLVDVNEENDVTVSVYDANDNSLMEQYSLAEIEGVPDEERPADESSFYHFIDNSPCLFFIVFLTGLGYLGLNLITDGSTRK